MISAALVTALILGSGTLGLNNYFAHYNNLAETPLACRWRSFTYFQAYGILKPLAQESGSLYFFPEFNIEEYENKALDLACYSFDASHNPKLSTSTPHWAAVLAHFDNESYLKAHFPGTQTFRLKSSRNLLQNSSTALFLIPVKSFSTTTLRQWLEADHIFQALNFKISDRNPLDNWSSFADRLLPFEKKFTNDPFLTDILFEKCAFYNAVAGNFTAATKNYQKAIQFGIPTARLYNNVGLTLSFHGEKVEAKKYFLRAAKLKSSPPI